MFRLTFSSPKQQIIIDLDKKVFYLTDFILEAGQAQTFSMQIRKNIGNNKLKSFYQHENDRIIVFEFYAHYLIVEFFAKGNLILTDKENKILLNFRAEREKWKERKIIKGQEYQFPKNIADVKLKEDYSPTTKQKYEEIKSMNQILEEKFAPKPKVNKDLEKAKRRLEAQKKTLKEYAVQSSEEREKGDLIYKNFALVEESINLFNSKKRDKIKGLIKGQKIILELD